MNTENITTETAPSSVPASIQNTSTSTKISPMATLKAKGKNNPLILILGIVILIAAVAGIVYFTVFANQGKQVDEYLNAAIDETNTYLLKPTKTDEIKSGQIFLDKDKLKTYIDSINTSKTRLPKSVNSETEKMDSTLRNSYDIFSGIIQKIYDKLKDTDVKNEDSYQEYGKYLISLGTEINDFSKKLDENGKTLNNERDRLIKKYNLKDVKVFESTSGN